MPDLVNRPYDPNSGEWFPYNGTGLTDSANSRSRAMYFFHNSLGEVSLDQPISFSNQITTGDSGSGGSGIGGWQGKASDIESWPITDNSELPIEVYSDDSQCYQYRIRSGNLRWHINHPPGWDLSLGNVENQTGVSVTDAAIYKRYVDALEFNLDGNTTKSIRLSLQDDDSEFRECLLDIELTYTDPDGTVRTCDGSYDQTTSIGSGNVTNSAGYFCSPPPLVNDFGTNENWLQKIGGAMDAANGGNSVNSDRVWTWPGSVQWMRTTFPNSVGQINFNRVSLDGGGGQSQPPEQESGQFIVGDVVDNYVFGDYLLLTALGDDAENDLFDQRVVRVSGTFETSDLVPAISIEILDDIGFEPQPEGEFVITKLTNAPKLKITYRVNESSATDTETIVATDNEDDV